MKGVIVYSTDIRNKDDAVHFPLYTFTNRFIVDGADKMSKDDVVAEISKRICDDIADAYGMTVEELKEDEAFISASISNVSLQIFMEDAHLTIEK